VSFIVDTNNCIFLILSGLFYFCLQSVRNTTQLLTTSRHHLAILGDDDDLSGLPPCSLMLSIRLGRTSSTISHSQQHYSCTHHGAKFLKASNRIQILDLHPLVSSFTSFIPNTGTVFNIFSKIGIGIHSDRLLWYWLLAFFFMFLLVFYSTLLMVMFDCA
jgi:hypothetical protein